MLLSDGQLVQATLASDGSAFDELVTRHRTRAYRLALSRVRDREEALDLAQDAFVAAYTSLHALRDPEKFGTWLTGILSNLCKMHFRACREMPICGEVIESMCPISIHSEAADEDAAMARQALDNLTDSVRSAAVLYFVEEMKQTEIAEFLGISLPAVKHRVREARLRLRREMLDMVSSTVKKEQPGDEFNKGLKHRIELAGWYREFSELIGVGVNIMASLARLRDGDYSPQVRDATAKLMDAIERGSTMADALEELPELRLVQTAGMIRAGEYGGMLEWTTRFLADWVEIENAQKDVELIYWCRTFGGMLAAGVNISRSLDLGVNIAVSKPLQQASRDMVRAYDNSGGPNAGSPLRPVLERYADVFPPLLQAAILAGEWAGSLDQTLLWAADQLAKDLADRITAGGPPTCEWKPGGAPEQALADRAKTMLADESPAIRAAAVTILARLGVSEAAAEIVRLIDDVDSETRVTVVRALAQLDYREAAEPLRARLSDSYRPARCAAIEAICSLQLTDLSPDLAELIADSDPVVVHDAISALESMGQTELLKDRATQLLADSVALQVAVGILMKYPDDSAADLLIKRLQDRDEMLTWKAALALAKLGRRECVLKLKEMLGLQIGRFREDAASALAEMGET